MAAARVSGRDKPPETELRPRPAPSPRTLPLPRSSPLGRPCEPAATSLPSEREREKRSWFIAGMVIPLFWSFGPGLCSDVCGLPLSSSPSARKFHTDYAAADDRSYIYIFGATVVLLALEKVGLRARQSFLIPRELERRELRGGTA